MANSLVEAFVDEAVRRAYADRLALTDKATLVLEKLPDGKIKVNSNSFEEARFILPDQVLEVRHFEGKIRIARKDRLPDAGDPPRTPGTYDPYGVGDEL